MRFSLSRSKETKLWLGTYERGAQRELVRNAREAQWGWDLGAHHGFFTVLLARRCERALAVEPFPRSAAAIRHNLTLNGLRADVLEVAVSATDGEASFALRTDDHQHRLSEEAGAYRVLTRSLDSLLAEFGRPDVVKLDLEGGEVNALAGAEAFLAAKPVLVVETHGAHSSSAISSLLRAHEYTLSTIGPNHLLAR
jgi:FkbM family methyltransferase